MAAAEQAIQLETVMKPYILHIWKVYFVGIVVYVVKMFSDGMLIFGAIEFPYIRHFYIAYFIFIVGLAGLAFGIRIINRDIWKFIFGVSIIYTFNWFILAPTAFVLSIPNILGQVPFMMLTSLPLFFLPIALYFYGWKSDHLWESKTPKSVK